MTFDYSYRQANYRAIELDVAQYRSRSMLIQFEDDNPAQLKLIGDQHLPLPNLDAIQQVVGRLRRERGTSHVER